MNLSSRYAFNHGRHNNGIQRLLLTVIALQSLQDWTRPSPSTPTLPSPPVVASPAPPRAPPTRGEAAARCKAPQETVNASVTQPGKHICNLPVADQHPPPAALRATCSSRRSRLAVSTASCTAILSPAMSPLNLATPPALNSQSSWPLYFCLLNVSTAS